MLYADRKILQQRVEAAGGHKTQLGTVKVKKKGRGGERHGGGRGCKEDTVDIIGLERPFPI